MNEQWKRRFDSVRQRAQDEAQRHVTPQIRKKVETWNENRRVNKLDFGDYTDDYTISKQEFENSRRSLIIHIYTVLKGDGGH